MRSSVVVRYVGRMAVASSPTGRARRLRSKTRCGWQSSPLNTKSIRIFSTRFSVIMKRHLRSSPRRAKPGRTVSIIGTGSYTPEKILTNADLSRMVDTSDEWITTRTGIKERRIAAKNETTSDMATKAALNAIEQAKISPKEIDLLLVATATPDMVFPATACFVQKKLGATRRAIDDAGLSVDDIACVIPHQANLRIIEAIGERLGIPREKVFVNLDRYGNTSAAAVAIALDEANRSGRIKPGDYVLMVVFGGGLTWASTVIEW